MGKARRYICYRDCMTFSVYQSICQDVIESTKMLPNIFIETDIDLSAGNWIRLSE